MTDPKPLSAEELAEAQVQFALIRRIATNQNATVDIPTLLEGTGRLLATIEARASELEQLRAALEQIESLTANKTPEVSDSFKLGVINGLAFFGLGRQGHTLDEIKAAAALTSTEAKG